MSDKSWKRSERQGAADLNTERIPVTGRQRDKHGADFEDELVMIQNKHGYQQPGYVLGWLLGICGTAAKHGKIGIVRWQAKGQRRKNSLVVMRWEDFVALHGRVEERG